MPCYDSRDRDGTFILEKAEAEWRHNSPVAEMLCDAMKLIERHKIGAQLPPALVEWWREHRERDAKKKENL